MPIHKRGNVYHVNVQLNGISERRSCGKGATYEQAKQIEAQIRRDIIDGKIGKVSYTLEDAIARWLETEALHLKDYQKIISNVSLIRKHIENTPLKEAQKAAERIILGSKGLSPATINRRLAIVRRACRLSAQWGWIQSPPVIKLLPGEKSREVVLSRGDIGRLAKRSGEARYHVIVAAFTGLRQSELLNLTKDDVRDNVLYVHNTKSGIPRCVPVPKPAQKALERMPLGMTYEVLRNRFEKARGNRDIRWHDLRHAYGYLCVQAGVDLRTLQQLMGHSTPTMTARYSRVDLESTSQKLQGLERVSGKTRVVKR